VRLRPARLADYTTLGLGGPARGFVSAHSEAELIAAVRAADASGEPVLILGGGSNLVVADDGFDGTVIQVATRGITRSEHGTITVAAGEPWDAVVARAVGEGLAGLECLSGIPGLAGATPIQNVGAYGQEVSQAITQVRAYDRFAQKVMDIPNDQCGFGYRTSVFKRGPGRFLVLGVTFRLTEQALSEPVRYAELAAALGVEPGDRVASTQARSAVIELRRRKGMVIDPADPDTRSVGSFFVNPVLDGAELAVVEKAARARYGDDARVPRFDAGDGLVKVPAAWLIEHAGFGKGFGLGDGVRISAKHTLALVNPGSGSTAALIALARAIRDGVRDTFGVTLAPEPVLVGVTL
jgi:UDP-N-acetylmuramate dehydrogenase